MSVIRNRHNSKSSYVILDKSVLWNDKISLKAIGLWARCISRPDNWRFNISELITKCKEGRDSVYKGINELIENKLCIRVQYYLTIRKDNIVYPGAGPIEYIFLEIPASNKEIEDITKELREEYEESLRAKGLVFYEPKEKKDSKKDYKLPGNKDPLNKDPLNPHLPIKENIINIYKEEPIKDPLGPPKGGEHPQKIERKPRVETTEKEHMALIEKYGKEIIDKSYNFLSEWKKENPRAKKKNEDDNKKIHKWVVAAVLEQEKRDKFVNEQLKKSKNDKPKPIGNAEAWLRMNQSKDS